MRGREVRRGPWENTLRHADDRRRGDGQEVCVGAARPRLLRVQPAAVPLGRGRGRSVREVKEKEPSRLKCQLAENHVV